MKNTFKALKSVIRLQGRDKAKPTLVRNNSMKFQFITLGILLSFNAFADGFTPSFASQDQPWSIIASFGEGKYQIPSRNKHNPIARLAIGNDMILTGDYMLGWELGLQNGNLIRLDIPKETLTTLGWLPVNTSLSPMLDLLITAKSDPLWNSSFFAQLKGGLAYRYWQIEPQQFKNLSQLAGEIQAGFGYPVNELAMLNLLYQGVFGSNASININMLNQTATISNIPSLHAVLLGLSVNL